MKVICMNCKKDMSEFVTDDTIELALKLTSNNEVQDKNEADMMVCPDCHEQGYALGICECGGLWKMNPRDKLLITTSLFQDEANKLVHTKDGISDVEGVYENGYMYILSECPSCSGNKEQCILTCYNIKLF